MIRRITLLLIAAPAAVLLIVLALANRHPVRFVLDPFRPENPVYAIDTVPFSAYLFITLIFGVILGGFATWLTQGQWRRYARVKTQEAVRWRDEADRLTRERDQTVAAKKKHPALPHQGANAANGRLLSARP